MNRGTGGPQCDANHLDGIVHIPRLGRRWRIRQVMRPDRFQPHAIDDREVASFSDDGRNHRGIDPIEQRPVPRLAAPMPDRLAGDGVIGEAVAGQNDHVNSIECFGHGRRRRR